MKRNLKILGLIVVILVLLAMLVKIIFDSTRPRLKECPNEKIINEMPGSPSSSYYIKDGARKEVVDYDEKWVLDNCSVPVQVVS